MFILHIYFVFAGMKIPFLDKLGKKLEKRNTVFFCALVWFPGFDSSNVVQVLPSVALLQSVCINRIHRI